MRIRKTVLLVVLIIVMMMLAFPLTSAFASSGLLHRARETIGDLPAGQVAEVVEPEPEPENGLSSELSHRPFPEWFNRLTALPDWIFDVDELPDWFYELEEMPVWFYTIPRVPQWFYTITEIPDWFYIAGELPSGGETDGGQPNGQPGGEDGWGQIEEPYFGMSKEGDTSPGGGQSSGWGLPDDYEWPEGWEWLENVQIPQGWDHSEWLYAHGWPSDLELPPGFARPPWPPIGPDDAPAPWDDMEGSEGQEGPEGPEGQEGGEGEGEEPEADENTLDGGLYPFAYQLPDESGWIGSDVPFGMITDGPVRLGYTVPVIMLMRDGEDVGVFSGSLFSQDGEYTAYLLSGEQVFSFRIIGTPVNDLTEYVAPLGFYIQTVRLEGEPETATESAVNADSYELEHDGTYVFTIASSEDDEVFGVVTMTLDTTPPELSFTGWQDGQESVPGPVEFFSDEEGVTIEVTLDGEEYIADLNTLTLLGSYVITATDLAGNEAVYIFSLAPSEETNMSAIWLIIIVVLILGAIATYLIRNRMKAKVR